MSSKRWSLYPKAPDEFIRSSHEHPVLMQVLYNRGLRDSSAIAAFLDTEGAVQENPFRLAGMAAATQRILAAINRQEVICVYGDFDADGVSATVLLVEALRRAGAHVGGYIPDRVDEGYGLNVESVAERIAERADLLITVDCGIRSVEEVAAINEMGLDVIVTDHHSIGPDLPPALAVVNPRRQPETDCFQELAGVGVAYRLAQAVLRAVSQEHTDASRRRLSADEAADVERTLLDLVAVGTVADMMPLRGENRSLVRRGIAQIRTGERAGLNALLDVAHVQAASVDSTTIAFRIAPRINAAGRLHHAMLAYTLLREQQYEQAYDHAAQLEQLNKERQRLTEDAQEEATAQLAEGDAAPLLFVSSETIPHGIVGLVAGRLADTYYRPAVVVQKGEEESRGSARSIEEFHITAALDEVRHLLVRHGGHRQAAGFTVSNQQLPALREALTAAAARTLSTHEELRPKLLIDAELPLTALNWALRDQLARLEPTGRENEMPLFLARDCPVRDVRTVGRSNSHLKMTLGAAGSPVFGAIAFRQGDRRSEIHVDDRVDVVFRLEVNEWNGRKELQLNVEDLRPVTH